MKFKHECLKYNMKLNIQHGMEFEQISSLEIIICQSEELQDD